MNSQLLKFRSAILIIISLAFMSAQKSHAQTNFPETPAGERGKEITELFNSGDKAKIEKYVENSFTPKFKNAFPLEQHAGIFIQIHNDNKKLNLYEVTSSSESQIVFTLLSSETNNLLNVELILESEDPHRIDLLGIRPAGKLEVKKKMN